MPFVVLACINMDTPTFARFSRSFAVGGTLVRLACYCALRGVLGRILGTCGSTTRRTILGTHMYGTCNMLHSNLAHIIHTLTHTQNEETYC